MFVKTEIWTVARLEQGTAVLLKPNDNRGVIPIYIGSQEAHSILAGLQKIRLPRPLSHDLILQFLRKTQYRITHVRIKDLRDGIYFAEILLESRDEEEKTLTLDARPSDAIALAAREGLPVYTAEAIVQETSVRIRMVNSRAFLEKELSRAVENEEYERAAQLRDQISSLDKRC